MSELESKLNFTHRFVPGERENGPVLLLLHGTGGNENDLLEIGRAVAPGAALLSPRGRVLENGMPRFFRRFAEGVFDVADIKLRAKELADFIGEAAEEYGFDSHNVWALGYSNGANIAAALLLLHPEVLAGGVLMRAMLPLVPDKTPALQGARVLLSEGTHDPIVPPDTAENLAAFLQKGGAEVDLIWQAGGHGVTANDFAAARDFLSG
jgi:predicted esterase